MTLLRRLKGVRCACYRICAAPKVCTMRRGEKKAAVGKAADRRAREDRKEERRRGEDQADRLCQPIRGALRGCRRPSRGARGSEERGAESGLSEDGSSCAVSTGKSPLCFSYIKFLSTS